MKKVRIAEFKSHLSAHLRQVQKGRELIVFQRDNPIAKVVPLERDPDRIVVRPAKVKGRLKGLKPAIDRPDIDIVGLLREDRDRR